VHLVQHDGARRRTFVGQTARDGVVNVHSQRVYVGAVIDRIGGEELFRSHVGGVPTTSTCRPDSEAIRTTGFSPRAIRQAQVDQLGHAILGHENVGRLHVAVNDAEPGRGGQAVGDLEDQVESVAAGKAGRSGRSNRPDSGPQRFRGRVGQFGIILEVPDADDVRVFELGEELGLARS